MADEPEAETREQRVDPKLRAAGWRVVPHDATRPLVAFNGCAVEEYPTEHGPADYALCVDGRILGIVEAKRLSLGPQNVLTQAERYSKGATSNPLNSRGYHVPFLYSTNGEVVWYHDMPSSSGCRLRRRGARSSRRRSWRGRSEANSCPPRPNSPAAKAATTNLHPSSLTAYGQNGAGPGRAVARADRHARAG